MFKVCMYAIDTHEFIRVFATGLTMDNARDIITSIPWEFPGFYGVLC
jgi:hypothetical protein